MLSTESVSIFLQKFSKKFFTDETTTLAASLAFYTAFSMAPLLILFVTISSFLSDDLLGQFLAHVRGIMGADAALAVQMVVDSAKTRPDLTSLAGTLGVVTLLFSASLIFGELRSALNRIFAVKPRQPSDESLFAAVWHFGREKIFQIGLALSFILVLIASLLATSLITAMIHQEARAFARWLNIGISFLSYIGIFTLVFRFLPDHRQPWFRAAQGGILTALLFVIGKELIGVYLGQSAISSAYGAAGSLVALLIWVYYSTLITFVGAHVSALLKTGASS